MASQKQIDANRRNAQLSTGPVTAEGKTTVSQNAISHALHSTRIVINSPYYKEDADQYDALLSSLVRELRPESAMQHHLVHKIANAMWRYRRVIRAETGQIERQFEYLEYIELQRSADSPDLDSDEGRRTYATGLDQRRGSFIDSHNLPPDEASRKILRYELRLDRQITTAYQMLRHLQMIEKANSLQEDHNEREK